MKKVLTLILITIAAALSSCHNDDEPAVISRQYANTVFVYMPWTGSDTSSSGSLTDNLRKNIIDIKRSIICGNGNNDSTRTIVFFASSATEGRLFEINADTTETTIRNYNEGAMTTTDGLTSLLNTVANTTKTPSYSIIIGAHASGWLPATSETYLSRSFGGTSQSQRTDITTLASAISLSTIGKVQYLCFDDCYMANVETAYAFRNITHWLIASTSEIMAEGLPYENIWKYLSSPTVNYSKIIAEFDNFYSNNPNYPYGTLSAIDCSKAADMADLMKVLNESTYVTGEYNTSNIQALDGYPVHIFFDMGSYLHDLCGDDSIRYKAVFDKLDELVPYHCCTPALITAMFYESVYSVNTSSGITISDPTTSPYAEKAKTQTEWWQATH